MSKIVDKVVEAIKPKKKMLPREQLIVPKVASSNDTAAYFAYGNKQDYEAVGCMGSEFDKLRDNKSSNAPALYVLPKHGVTIKDVAHWCMFLTRCGFKCTVEEPVNKNVVAVIKFSGKDYLSGAHMHLGITAARYICRHVKGYSEIPHLATSLYAEHEELDAYQAFILAHYFTSAGVYFEPGYGVVCFGYGCPNLITKEEMLDRFKTNNYSLNQGCTTYKADGKLKMELIGLAQKGNSKKIIKQLLEK